MNDQRRYARYQFTLAPGTALGAPVNAARGMQIQRVTLTQAGVGYSSQILTVEMKEGKDSRLISIPSGQSRLLNGGGFRSNILYGLSVASPVAGDILVELEGYWTDEAFPTEE